MPISRSEIKCNNTKQRKEKQKTVFTHLRGMVSNMQCFKLFIRPRAFMWDLNLTGKQFLTFITFMPLLQTHASHYFSSQVSQLDSTVVDFFSSSSCMASSTAVKASYQRESFLVSSSLISPISVTKMYIVSLAIWFYHQVLLDNHEQWQQSALYNYHFYVAHFNKQKIAIKYLKLMPLFLITTFSDLKKNDNIDIT